MVFVVSRLARQLRAPVPAPPPGRGRVRVRLQRLMKHRTNGVVPRPPTEIEEAQDVVSEELERLDSDTIVSVPDDDTVVSKETLEMWQWDSALVSQLIKKYEDDFAGMERKIHSFPSSLSDFRRLYGRPVAVWIGPMAAKSRIIMVKNVAMHHFISGTTFGSVEEMFKDFFSAVGDFFGAAQRNSFDDDDYYDTDTNSDKDDDDHHHYDGDLYNNKDDDKAWYSNLGASSKFRMLRDGCFLLEYMQHVIGPDDSMPKLLVSYFKSNEAAIDRDIMLLENQLPWVVIKTLAGYKKQGDMIVKEFVAKMARTLQVRKGPDDSRLPDTEGKHSPSPSHLLGLLRSYKIGYNDDGAVVVPMLSDGTRPMSRTINAIELAEIGIKLTASKTSRFIDMGLKKTLLGAEFFLPPLLLDKTRLCWLVNMAALELYVATYAASSTSDAEKRAVSAYLVVFAMLMDREEDVHALRSKGLLQGELTNQEILNFFKELVKHISGGPLYIHMMEEIEDYKITRRVRIKLYKFFYKNYKTIAALLSIAGVLAGIFRALVSLKHP